MKEETKFRIGTTIIGIFIPPVAVLLVYGFGRDFIINCLLLLLGFFPSTIHQICLDRSYWNRRSRVREGRYPGDKHSWIFSKDSQNGGASDKEVERLKLHGKTKEEVKQEKKAAKKEKKQAKKQGQDPEKGHSRNSSQNPHGQLSSSQNPNRGRSPRRSQSAHRQPGMNEGRPRTPNGAPRPVSQHGPHPQHASPRPVSKHGPTSQQAQPHAQYPAYNDSKHTPQPNQAAPYAQQSAYQSSQHATQPADNYNSNGAYNNPRFSDKYDPNGIYGPPGAGATTGATMA